MNILIFGAGAIGCHIAYCMNQTGNTVYLIGRGPHLKSMKESGLNIKIFNNDILENDDHMPESSSLLFMDDPSNIDNSVVFDYVFITVKLSSYNEKTLHSIERFFKEDTAIIPPCTKMPFWWFFNLSGKYNNIDFDPSISKFFNKENIIMMTMWLSAVIQSPGHVVIKHTQRGYPLGPVYPKMDKRAEVLKDIFNKTCISPDVNNIRSEIYIKSINSLAFNAAALDKEYDNFQLDQDMDSKESIKKIMIEGGKILESLKIPISQDIDARISQTLSSKNHTMSMLHDYQNGKGVELPYIWDGFEKISKVLDIKMSYTKKVVERIQKKISNSNVNK